jgi:hypothetical protein
LSEVLEVLMSSAIKGKMHFVVGEELRWDVWGFDPGVARTPRLKAFTTWRGKMEMGRTRGTCAGREVLTEFWRGDLRKKDYLENLSANGWIILKWIFKKWDGGID